MKEFSAGSHPLNNDFRLTVRHDATTRDEQRGPPMKPRVAFYSHDAQGLGHMRRNLALAGRVVQDGRRSALLITGAREAGALPMPDGVECLTLPALRKTVDGDYGSRSLDLPLASLLRLRAETVCSVLEVFEPDVFVVDKHPLGFGGELEAAVSLLRARGGTRLVLGLREVLDEPEVVREEWRSADTEAAIATFYDQVWVYGDRRVYDPVAEYGFSPAVASKVRYTGYLAPELPDGGDTCGPLRALDLPDRRMALCLVGGGQDGAALAEAFVHAPVPDDMVAVTVAGPFMPARTRERLHAAAADRAGVRVLDFVRRPQELLACADRVVAMGGYNTVCELLSADRPGLIVPRERPRREQLLRAQRLEELGVLDVMRADDLSPDGIGGWLAADRRDRVRAADVIDLDGLRRVPELLVQAVAAPRNQEVRSRVA
jgi:predicted glycosyltransferase